MLHCLLLFLSGTCCCCPSCAQGLQQEQIASCHPLPVMPHRPALLMLPLLPLQTHCIGSVRRSMTGAGRSSWSCPKCWKASLSPTPLSSRLRFRSSGVFVSGLGWTQPYGPAQPFATVCHHLAALLKARLSAATVQRLDQTTTLLVPLL